jgi:hypothetical protein
MSYSEPELTPELQSRVLSFLRAGGYPAIAAEAAGVPRRLFEKWLRRGGHRKAQSPFRAFAEEVRQASAQARLRAEIAIFDKRPLDWLKCGPGKETSGRPGWSVAPKAHTAVRSREGNPLADPALQGILADMKDALTPYPEARATLADKIPEWTRSRHKRPPDGEL